MRYTIQNISHEVHDLDDDCIYFRFDIHFTEHEELTVIKYFESFSSLFYYIRDKHPDFHAYLQSVRGSIDGWGPCEPRILEAMGEEALQQLYNYLEEFMLCTDWVPELYELEKRRRSESVQEQIKTKKGADKVVASLGMNAGLMKYEQKRYYRFCETVEKQIRQTAAEVYPELVDGDAEQLKEFKHMFVRDIQSMHSRIQTMIAKYKDQ